MKRLVGLFFFSGLFFIACEEDPKPYKTTPYSLNIPDRFPGPVLPADNPLTVEGVELGKRLFYEPKLSINNSISCASCHKQEFAFSDGGKAVSEGFDGTLGTRNSMALFNMFYHQEMFWDGRAVNLREQVLQPIEDPIEMAESLDGVLLKLNADIEYRDRFKKAFDIDQIDKHHLSLALEQFILSLTSFNSKFDKLVIQQGIPPQQALSPSEFRGFQLLQKEFRPPGPGIPPGGAGDCFHCHNTPLFRIDKFSNNGLDASFSDPGRSAVTGDPADRGKFKVPSLRNIAVSGPYMHDGRFSTLDEVLEHYSSGLQKSPSLDANMVAVDFGGLMLTTQDKADLKAFMEALTDSTFLTDPRHENPFK